MIEDLASPEPSPTNTKMKIESIEIRFDDQNKASVRITTVKGFANAGVFQRDDRTRERYSADGLEISQNMGTKQIIQAVKLAIAARADAPESRIPINFQRT